MDLKSLITNKTLLTGLGIAGGTGIGLLFRDLVTVLLWVGLAGGLGTTAWSIYSQWKK